MALIDLWKQRVAGHDFNTENLSAENSDNYTPHNSLSRPIVAEGVTPSTLVNIDEVERQYFKDENIPSDTNDNIMKSRNKIDPTFGTTSYAGLSSIISTSNTGSGYIHHFAGSKADAFVPGFSRGNTGVGYDVAAAIAPYDTETTEGDDTGGNGDTPQPLTFEEWKATRNPNMLAALGDPQPWYHIYLSSF